jgi:hypothetical protein
MPLTHKFAKGSWFEIFRNEGMWSTPLDPKLMFWSVSDRFVTARMSMQTGQTGTINAKFAKQGRVRIFRNGHTQSIPLDTKLMFWGVSNHFDTVLKSMQNQPNWCHSHKFAKQSRVGISRNERTRSTQLHPKLMFWGVSDRFVTSRKSMQNWPNWCYYPTSSINKVAS